jgi:pyruvate dehydrogenase E2 component (dihydrolipoamide acetyltransferase)
MEEGKVLTWLKEVGDQVEIGDIIAEVETDKADMEMEALDEGILIQILVPEGGSVPVGGVLALLGTADELGAEASVSPTIVEQPSENEQTAQQPVEAAATAAESSPPATPVSKVRELRELRETRAQHEPSGAAGAAGTAGAAGAERVIASPLVKRMADELKLDLDQIPGTGPGGRIVKRDIEAFTAQGVPAGETQAVQAQSGSQTSATPAGQSVPQASATPAPAGTGAEKIEPFSRMRATIAKRMSESMREAPHFYLTSEINMSEAVRLRTSLKASDRITEDVTYTHLLVKATAVALARHPRINASFAGDARAYKEEINIGLAVSLDDGLIVPVLHGCEQLSLLDIAGQANALVERARTGKPKAEDLSGGTFTISNLGMLPIEHFTAIINQPQGAILAVGAIKERPVVRDGQVTIASTMMATLSCDHRIIDGMTGGQFLAELKTLLENPVGLMV